MRFEKSGNIGLHLSDPLVFILGHPLKHSLSPLMQNAAFRALKIPWVYAPLEVRPNQMPQAVETLRAENVRGCNVTVPHKEAVLPFLDQVEEPARRLGSVNTIYKKGGRLVGASTDGEGFLRSLGPWRKRLAGARVLLVGAGGSGRAVAAALAGSGIKSLSIANRSWNRAEQLVRTLLRSHPKLESQALSLLEGKKMLRQCDWVIQTTSVGLNHWDPSPLPLQGALPRTFVVDLIYHHETRFLTEARQKGLPSLNGLGMLLHQGALSFEYWTGRRAPLPIMKRVLRKALAFK